MDTCIATIISIATTTWLIIIATTVITIITPDVTLLRVQSRRHRRRHRYLQGTIATGLPTLSPNLSFHQDNNNNNYNFLVTIGNNMIMVAMIAIVMIMISIGHSALVQWLVVTMTTEQGVQSRPISAEGAESPRSRDAERGVNRNQFNTNFRSSGGSTYQRRERYTNPPSGPQRDRYSNNPTVPPASSYRCRLSSPWWRVHVTSSFHQQQPATINEFPPQRVRNNSNSSSCVSPSGGSTTSRRSQTQISVQSASLSASLLQPIGMAYGHQSSSRRRKRKQPSSWKQLSSSPQW